MLRKTAIALAVCLVAGIAGTGLRIAHAQTGYPRLAPYPSIRWTPEVWIDGQWYALRSIDGVPVEKIIAFAVKEYGDGDRGWKARFSEDLVQVLSEMGHPPGETVKLVVVDPKTGKEKTLNKVSMTKENRDSISYLAPGQIPVAELKAEHLKDALDDFQAALNERWSYRHANGADLDAAIAALREKIDTSLSPNEFGIELQKIVALGIDGHADVTGYRLPRGGLLPFLVESEGERFVAFKSDRSGFLANGFPYLTKIDGRKIDDWCAAASVLVPKGSPQYVRRHCLGHLRRLDYLRGLMKLPRTDTVEIELAGKDGTTRKTLALPVADKFSFYGDWPREGSRLLEENVGYLRLPRMDPAAVAEIKAWMPKFRDTAGLVVDVRDNGGGIRDPLRLLYSFLAFPDDPPRVFNAAAYRLHRAHQENHLAARFMYRADASEWTDEERRTIAAFAKTFRPEWKLPESQFSDWHYMVLSRLDDPDIYHYRKPVVVLMNAKCFSATDIFLAGLKGMKNVTLVGMPSGGGSAFTQDVGLGETPLVVEIGSMASFQSDGKLFDGNGVQPDVIVEPVPEYYIGGRDNALEEAVKRIKGR